MAKNIHHFKNFSVIQGDIKINLKLERFTSQFNKSQYALDSAVMTSMIPYMPMQSGTFINRTKARSASLAGTGQVCAAASPEGQFLYEGKTMVDIETGSTWARKGAKKVLVSQYAGKTAAKENLEFSKNSHPRVQAHWFEPAKEADGANWVKTAKRVAGGGVSG